MHEHGSTSTQYHRFMKQSNTIKKFMNVFRIPQLLVLFGNHLVLVQVFRIPKTCCF